MRIDLISTAYTMGNRPLDVVNIFDSPRGLTGTELNFVGVACALALRGHEVRAFTLVEQEVEADGAVFLAVNDYERYRRETEVVVTYHDSSPLDWALAKVKIASHHVYVSPILNFSKAMYNTAPSRSALMALRGFAPETFWRVLPNGVDLGNYRPWMPVPGRVVYHTSSTRGLHLLLEAMPQVLRKMSEAHLVVVGRHDWVESWISTGSPAMKQIGTRVKEALDRPPSWLIIRGEKSRNETLEILSSASCFAFPCSVVMPCETFSVSTMEACRIGVPVVLSPVDALAEIYQGSVDLSPSSPDVFLEAFIGRVAKVLTDKNYARYLSERERAMAGAFTFENTASKLEAIIAGQVVL